MALKVIGAGFGRTGTMSLKLALEALGLGKCHHMEEVFADPGQVPYWERAARGEPVDWDAVYRGFGATVDWPGAHYWRELAEHFPEARVILTVRSPESWWASYSETIMKFLEIVLPRGGDDVPARMAAWCAETVGRQTFGTSFADREAGLRAFDRRIADVRAALPAERVLVYEVKDGWEPLCDFLGLRAPEMPFPRANDRSEFWKNFSPEAA